MVTGLYGFQAVAPALYRRALRGGGVHIATSLMEAVGAFQSAKMVEHVLQKGEQPRLGVPVAMFEAKDGFLNINGRRDAHFASLCGIVGLPELADDPKYRTMAARLENEDEIMPRLRRAIVVMGIEVLTRQLAEADVLHARVQDYGDYFESEHVREVEAVRWVEQSGAGRIPMPTIPGVAPARDGDSKAHAPHLGEHSRDILGEFGFTKAEIDALARAGAIGLPDGSEAAA